MNAQITLGTSTYTVRGADHLHVAGDLVEIQRSGPDGFETVAVAGDDLLVTIEPSGREPAGGVLERSEEPLWCPVGVPLD
jgi:hypothetical protein